VEQRDLEAAMAAMELPVAIALWIMTFRPGLAQKSELTIALLGDHFFPDQGEWLLSLPFLLGNAQLHVRFLVGSHEPGRRLRSTGLPVHQNPGQIRRIAADFSGVQAILEERSLDLALVNGIAVLVDPAFREESDRARADSEILAITKMFSSVGMIGGISTSEAAFALDSGVLSAAGFGMESKPCVNAITLDGKTAIQGPYHTLWKVSSYIPPKDHDTVSLVIARFASIFDAFAALAPLADPNLAKWGVLLGQDIDSEGDIIVGLPGALVAEIDTGEIKLEVSPGELMESEFLSAVVEREPELRDAIRSWNENLSVLERMRWAADIFNRWIEPHMQVLGPQLLAIAFHEHMGDLRAGLEEEDDSQAVDELADDLRDVVIAAESSPMVALQSALTIALEAVEQLVEEPGRALDDSVLYRELLDRRMLAAAVHFLSDRPSLVNHLDSDGVELEHLLAIASRFDLLCHLITEHEPEFSEESATHLLWHLCEDDYKPTGFEQKTVFLLSTRYADLNVQALDFSTPLAKAIETKKWDVCRALCELGAHFDARYFAGRLNSIKQSLPSDLLSHFEQLKR
jgi:hypothetical protein